MQNLAKQNLGWGKFGANCQTPFKFLAPSQMAWGRSARGAVCCGQQKRRQTGWDAVTSPRATGGTHPSDPRSDRSPEPAGGMGSSGPCPPHAPHVVLGGQQHPMSGAALSSQRGWPCCSPASGASGLKAAPSADSCPTPHASHPLHHIPSTRCPAGRCRSVLLIGARFCFVCFVSRVLEPVLRLYVWCRPPSLNTPAQWLPPQKIYCACPMVVGAAPGRREGTSEVAPEAIRWAVGGGCQSGWGRLLSVTNAIDAGTCHQGDTSRA